MRLHVTYLPTNQSLIFCVLSILICCFQNIQGNVEVADHSPVNDTDQEVNESSRTRYNIQSDADSTENKKIVEVQDLTSCSCDLTSNSRDVSCCCDQDCSTEDRKSFSTCIDAVAPPGDVHLCGRGSKKSSSDFCVWKDNYEERHFLPDQAALTLTELETVVAKAERFTDVVHEKIVKVDVDGPFLIYLNSTFKSVLGVPYPILGHACNSYLVAQFGHNEEVECFQLLKSVADECETKDAINAAYYYKDVEAFDAKERPILVELCHKDSRNCKSDTDAPVPYYDISKDLCMNIVSSVEYVVRHRGINSILNVTARISLSNVSPNLVGQTTTLKQKFKVTFEWSDDKLLETLSGNPGYVLGYPVLARSISEKLKRNDNHWLMVRTPTSTSECVDSTSIPVLFGENVVATCSITVSAFSPENVCSKLGQVMDMVLNSSLPSHIGAYGNSSRNKTGDWVPFLPEDSLAHVPKGKVVFEDNKCTGIVRELHIELAYVHVGFSNNRQDKIIGALLTTTVDSVWPTISRNQHAIWTLSTSITVSVTFLDVTVLPSPIFAAFPTFDIRLPYDFFNPF